MDIGDLTKNRRNLWIVFSEFSNDLFEIPVVVTLLLVVITYSFLPRLFLL
jgi:hypothetical protein